jgi:hypothetical protein
MSVNPIAYLDFEPGNREQSLTERAVEAYRERKARFETELLQIAHDKIVDVLDVMTATDPVIKITDWQDGDGYVEGTVDGMRIKVRVMFPQDRDLTDGPDNVELQVATKGGWQKFDTLVDLGRLIEGGTVKCATD